MLCRFVKEREKGENFALNGISRKSKVCEEGGHAVPAVNSGAKGFCITRIDLIASMLRRTVHGACGVSKAQRWQSW